MLSYPVATAAFLLLLGSDGDAVATPKQKMEFLSAMNTHKSGKGRKLRHKLTQKNQKDFMSLLQGKSKESVALREKLKMKSTVKKAPGKERKLQNYNYSNNGNQANGNNAYGYNANSGNNNGNNANQANGNNANAYQANNNYNSGNNANANANANYQNGNNGDTTDDYFMAYGDWENNFGFDYSQFSLSYHRCASVSQYDDEVAATEDTSLVFATKHFAVFRFCPETTCMGFESEDFCDDESLGVEYCDMMRERAEFGERVQNEQADMYYEECDEEVNGEEYCRMIRKQEEWEKVQMEETILYGARGEGCQENYGEYMIELEDYLQLMLEYQMERFQTYCEYCDECMYNVYQVWLENGGFNQNDDDDKARDDYYRDDRREEEDDDAAVDPSFYEVCPEYSTCSMYKTLCEEEIDETLTEYFECAEVEGSNGQVAYVGPHCAEDGFTVTLGVYSDEYCNQYIGNGVNIANFIGEDIDIEEDILKPWYNSANGALEVLQYSNEENVCIPCNKMDLPYEESEYEDQYNPDDDDKEYEYQQQEDDRYEDNRNFRGQELNEICENLYLVSARCNKHFRSYSSKSTQAKYRDAIVQEDLSCDFIDSIVMGNYNEMGFVNLEDTDSQSAWLKNNMYAQEYGHYITEVSPLQVFGLVASLCACAILAVWSMTLHKSMSKKGPWRPTRGVRSVAAPGNTADLGRQDSGIMLGRSRTDASYYMS